jgi:hypothetical protein
LTVPLVGEYVIAIVRSIGDRVDCLNPDLDRAFLMRNPAYFRNTKERVTSYWNCYYREQQREDYAGFQVAGFVHRLLLKSHLGLLNYLQTEKEASLTRRLWAVALG